MTDFEKNFKSNYSTSRGPGFNNPILIKILRIRYVKDLDSTISFSVCFVYPS